VKEESACCYCFWIIRKRFSFLVANEGLLYVTNRIL